MPEPLEIESRTAWAEARGDGIDGMTAVLWVEKNRAALAAEHVARHGTPDRLFGDGTMASACLVPRQFSCWNGWDRSQPLPPIPSTELDDPAYQMAFALASQVEAGVIVDPTEGATHYCTILPPPGSNFWPPTWATAPATRKTATIGSHNFYHVG